MHRSKKIGDIAEKESLEYLESLGFVTVSLNEEYTNRYDYDIIATGDINLTFEVKNDVMASKTGNVAIEFWNSRKNEPSGINRTQADFWIHKINGELLLCSVKSLKEFVNSHKPHRIVYGGGDNNADIMLFKIDDFREITLPLNTLSKTELEKLLCD